MVHNEIYNALLCIYRLFMTGYLPVGYELAIELTYPVPEGTSSGLLNGGTQLIGFILTSVYSWVFSTMGDLAANMMIVGLLTLGFLLTIFIPTNLKRQAAHKAIDDKQKLGLVLWTIILYKFQRRIRHDTKYMYIIFAIEYRYFAQNYRVGSTFFFLYCNFLYHLIRHSF